jgi:4-amino-4-deoxy-L-arabinose transferase-like glycosyltransferase
MRYDESFTYLTYASKPFFVLMSNYSEPNNHILHSILVKISSDLFGAAPWAIRLPGFLFGVLLPLLVFWLASRFYSIRLALTAAALSASNSYLIEYSTIGRGYTMLCFFSLLIFGAAHSLKEDQENDLGWFAIVVCGALGFYTIPIMVYPLAGSFLYLFVFLVVFGDSRSKSFIKILSCGLSVSLIGLLLYSPVFLVSGFQQLFANKFVSPKTFVFVKEQLPDSLLETVIFWFRDVSAVGAGILGFVLILFFTKDRKFIFLVLSVLASSVALVFIQRVVPFERVWIFILPLFLIAAARGLFLFLEILSVPLEKNTTLAVPIIICCALAYLVYQNGSIVVSKETGVFPEASQLIDSIAPQLKEGDIIVAAAPSDFPLKYYAARKGLDLRHFDVTRIDERSDAQEYFIVNRLYERSPRRAMQMYNIKLSGSKLVKDEAISQPTFGVYKRD